MAIHEKAWIENAPGHKQHYVMPCHDVIVVQNAEETWMGLYIDGQLIEQGETIRPETWMRFLGGEFKTQDMDAFEEADYRFPPRLLDVEWKATDQNAPVDPLKITGR